MKSVRRKKISTILPADLLAEAARLSGANQTDTLILALEELVRSYRRRTVLDLKGKLDIKFDVQRERERRRF